MDDEFTRMMRERRVCYVVTLTWELPTCVHSERPGLFDDPLSFEDESAPEMERVTAAPFQRNRRSAGL